MKPWYHTITPHRDIREGKFDESVFAADLSDVMAGRASVEYRDPVTFFRKTYPTHGLRNLLAAVLKRLSGSGHGESVIQIQTPFGGGKTHSLIALYHVFKHAQELEGVETVAEILKEAHTETIPQTRVVSFVGTALDALGGRTPWGELAHQLEEYEQLKEHDRRRRTPGKDLLHKLLHGEPTLILMDELAEYAVKAKDFRDQVVAFMQELTETVKVLPRCALVVTLPSSAPYGEEGERALHELQQIFKRVETIKTPVEGEEIYEVIRRRLFEDHGDEREIRRVAEAYWELYQRLGDDVPREVRELAYRERMRKAYPFHPELIDVLFERWSTFPDFQRTRGVLRLLAQIVAELYRQQHPAPLIQPCHINLTDPAIRAEFLRHIGNEYQGVIASDIGGPNAKAEKIDREMGSEYARFRIASGVARAIFFASFSGSEKKGVGIQRLRLAVLTPEIPPAIVSDALRRLEDELWYLHTEGGLYSFSSQPNLNRVIIEREEAIKPEQIEEEIERRLEHLAGRDIEVRLFPHDTHDVPDTKELKLAVLPLDYPRQASQTEEFAKNLLTKCGQTFRVYRNTLVLLGADDRELASLRENAKRWLALQTIADDKELMRRLSDENKRWLETKRKDAEGKTGFQLLSAFRHLAKAGVESTGSVEWHDLGIPTAGEKTSLASRVREYLHTQELLLEKLSPRRLVEKAWPPEDQETPIEEIIEAFRKYPNLPMISGAHAVLDAIVQGVQEGIWGVRVGEKIYFREAVPRSALEGDAVLVRAGHIPVSPPAPQEIESSTTLQPTPAPPPPAPRQGIQTYSLRAKVPWDKLSDFVRGVVTPLRQDGAELEIEVSLQAHTQSQGIKNQTLEQKVRETLKQIGAELLDESQG